MTVTVYVWLPTAGAVGHASMQLENGTYISLWPSEGVTKTNKMKSQHGARIGSLDEDIYTMRSDPDRTFYISDLDEGAIQSWWDNFDDKYNLIGQNCCNAVIGGLRAGGSDGKLSYSDREIYRTSLIWIPATVADYCRKLTDTQTAHKLAYHVM